jgi:hypothetical protein
MKVLKDSPANLTRISRLDDVWQKLLDEALERGFHGTVSVELLVADGTIQRITRTIQRVEK